MNTRINIIFFFLINRTKKKMKTMNKNYKYTVMNDCGKGLKYTISVSNGKMFS